MTLSLCKSAGRSKADSSELVWPRPDGGQGPTGVDVEMGAAMGDGKEEETEGLSEDWDSEPRPDSEGASTWPELEGRAEKKREESGEEGSLALG